LITQVNKNKIKTLNQNLKLQKKTLCVYTYTSLFRKVVYYQPFKVVLKFGLLVIVSHLRFNNFVITNLTSFIV
jgi:hypothetical protein